MTIGVEVSFVLRTSKLLGKLHPTKIQHSLALVHIKAKVFLKILDKPCIKSSMPRKIASMSSH